MKKHSFLAALTAFAMCLTSFLVLPAYALKKGDVDNDNDITASDARRILRVSVGLENVDEETRTAADVDNDNTVTASDARLVLRVSVGLDDLHEHVYRYEQIKDENGNVNGKKCLRICDSCNERTEVDHVFGDTVTVIPPTCNSSGTGYKECVNCGYKSYRPIPKRGHSYTIKLEEKKKTCTEDGYILWQCDICKDEWREEIKASHNPGAPATCTSAQVCLDCGEVLVPALGHKIDNYDIGITKGLKCSRCGEEAIPSFNDLVNSLKDKDTVNRYSGFTKTVQNVSEVNGDGMFLLPMDPLKPLEGTVISNLRKEMLGTTTSFDPFVTDRLVTDLSFPIAQNSKVSLLEDNDINSIKTTKEKGIDFINALPDSYTVKEDKKSYDLKDFKNSPIGDVYKISVTLPTESFNEKTIDTSDTISKKIYSDIRPLLKNLTNGLKSTGTGMDTKLSRASFVSDITVDYYIDAKTGEVYAADYQIGLSLDFEIAVSMIMNETNEHSMGNLSMKMKINIDDMFFFNDNFNTKNITSK